MSNRDDLILCTATLQPDPMTCTVADFREQLDAAATAGFSGVSQWELHHGALAAEGFSTEDMAAALADHGLTMPVLGSLLPFSGSQSDALEVARRTFDLANRFGAGLVPTISLMPDEFESIEAASDRYGAVCDLAESHGLVVPIEFLPWSAIPDLATAWRIVDASDRPSGGILLDTWHWQRQPGGPDTELLAQIPPSFLPLVELSDAGPEAADDLYGESLTQRLLPGDGAIDFGQFFTALYATGADPVLATEVLNADMADAGRIQMAAAIATSTRQVVEPFV